MSVVSINELRVDRTGDARMWSPLECLKACVRELESGDLKAVDGVYIAMMRRDEEGQLQSTPYYSAGMTVLELRGLLMQHSYEICDRFRHQ